MAEEVVDGLEPIEVEQQHGHGAMVGDQAGQVRDRRRPVEQPGQHVVTGEVLELAAGQLELADVVSGHDHAVDDRIGEQVADLEAHLATLGRPVGAAHGDLDRFAVTGRHAAVQGHAERRCRCGRRTT